MTTVLSGVLRVIVGFGILATLGTAAAQGGSPFIIAPFAVVFTILFIQGKWRDWRRFSASEWLTGLPVTFAAQTILAGIVYLAGLGIGVLLGRTEEPQAFAQGDLIWPTAVLAIAVPTGFVIQAIERANPPRSKLEELSGVAMPEDIRHLLDDGDDEDDGHEPVGEDDNIGAGSRPPGRPLH